jgi:hypothetical protein
VDGAWVVTADQARVVVVLLLALEEAAFEVVVEALLDPLGPMVTFESSLKGQLSRTVAGDLEVSAP